MPGYLWGLPLGGATDTMIPVNNQGVTPTQMVSALRQNFKKEQKEQGIISQVGSKSVDMFKNIFLKNSQTSSNSIQEQLNQLEQRAQLLEAQGVKPNSEAYQEFMGQAFKTVENVDRFDKTNNMAGNIAKTAASTIAIVGGTALAPATGGASLAAAAAVGAGSNILTEYVDKNTSEGKVTLNPFGGQNRMTLKDTLKEGISGVAGGLMSVAGRTLGSAVTNPLKKTLPEVPRRLLKNQLAGATSGAGSDFTNTIIKDVHEHGAITGDTLKKGIKKAGVGAIGGAIAGTVAGATKVGLEDSMGDTAKHLARFERSVTRKVVTQHIIPKRITRTMRQHISSSFFG